VVHEETCHLHSIKKKGIKRTVNWNHKAERVFPYNLPHKKKKPLFGTCPPENSLIDIPGHGKQQS
jgi:hypothetical protein